MRLVEHFFRLIAPSECVSCGTEGSLLCIDCTRQHLKRPNQVCYRCLRPSDNYRTCNDCRRHSLLAHAWVRTEYTQAARNLVHALKFSYAKEAAEAIAAEITAALPLLSPDTVIVHAPAATSHVRMRGFDQSALIARAVARRLRLPHVHVLARMGQQRQVGSSGAVRREQMKDAFRVISPIVDGIPVLLIDDVLTTGSTLEAAAIALKRAGALRVDAATFAKAR